MNRIRIIDRNDKFLDEFETEFEYKIGEVIVVNSSWSCKCKEIVQGLEANLFIFVKGWIEFGF